MKKNMRTHLLAFRKEKNSWNSRRHLQSENYIHFLIGLTTKQFIEVSFLFALKVHCDNCISLRSLSMPSSLQQNEIPFIHYYSPLRFVVARVRSLAALNMFATFVRASKLPATHFSCDAELLLGIIFTFFLLLVDTPTTISTMRKQFV